MKSAKHSKEMKIIPDENEGLAEFAHQTHGAAAVSQNEVGELALDVFQTEKEIVVIAPIAGVLLKDISITLTDEKDKILEIKGNRTVHFNVEPADYVTSECFWGPFSRSIILPDCADLSGVSASFKNGILTVRVPKTERIEARVVEIKEE